MSRDQSRKTNLLQRRHHERAACLGDGCDAANAPLQKLAPPVTMTDLSLRFIRFLYEPGVPWGPAFGRTVRLRRRHAEWQPSAHSMLVGSSEPVYPRFLAGAGRRPFGIYYFRYRQHSGEWGGVLRPIPSSTRKFTRFCPWPRSAIIRVR